MAKNKYAVGAEVEAHCTKCKMDRLHKIETLKSDGNINRVFCETCEGIHLFRRPKTKPAKKASSPRRKKGSVQLSDAEAARAKPYAMTGVFGAGDIIAHKTFGPGKVILIRANKMEVGFEDGAKLLVCRNK